MIHTTLNSVHKSILCRLLNYIILVVASCYFSSGIAAEKTLDKVQLLNNANQLLKNNQMSELLNLLAPHELKLAGDAQYDYLLGISLLDTGNPSLAVQVLQRAIDVLPNYAGARLALARAYFDASDHERARYHFNILKSMPPPAHITSVIDKYLLAIDRLSNQYTPNLLAWLEAGGGYDTNANAATSDELFLGFQLSSVNVESASSFASFSTGLFYNHPINTEWNFSTTANYSYRNNPSAHFVDLSRAMLEAKLDKKYSFGTVYGKWTGLHTSVDNKTNQRKFQGNIGLDIGVTDTLAVNLNAYYAKQNFEQLLEVRDVNSFRGSIALINNFSGEYNQIGINLSYGEDDAVKESSPYSNSQYSLQVFSRFAVGNQNYAHIQLAAQDIDFDDNKLFFGLQREDKKYVFSSSYAWFDFPSSNWQLTASLDLIKHESNIELYEYDRMQTALSIRKTFD